MRGRQLYHSNPCDSPHHHKHRHTQSQKPPNPCQYLHIAVLIALVGSGIASWYQLKSSSHKVVFQGIEKCIILDDQDMLNVEAVISLCP